MRASVVAAFMLLSGIPATAAEMQEDVCHGKGAIAVSVMKNRQSGFSQDEQFEAADQMNLNENRLVIRRLIVLAYQVPVYASDQERRNAIGGFQYRARKHCQQMAVE